MKYFCFILLLTVAITNGSIIKDKILVFESKNASVVPTDSSYELFKKFAEFFFNGRGDEKYSERSKRTVNKEKPVDLSYKMATPTYVKPISYDSSMIYEKKVPDYSPPAYVPPIVTYDKTDSYDQGYDSKPMYPAKPVYKETNYGESSSSYGQQAKNYETKTYEVKTPMYEAKKPVYEVKTQVYEPKTLIYTKPTEYSGSKTVSYSQDSGSSYDVKPIKYEIPKVQVPPTVYKPPTSYGDGYNNKPTYNDGYDSKKTIYTSTSYSGGDSYVPTVPSYKPPSPPPSYNLPRVVYVNKGQDYSTSYGSGSGSSSYSSSSYGSGSNTYGSSGSNTYGSSGSYGSGVNYQIPSAICPSKYAEPIWGGPNGDEIIETYCRCDDSYGFTCTEGYRNPCTYDVYAQFFPADPSLPKHYFIHCSWTIPYLKRCPRYLIWNQDIQACDWEAKHYAETKYTTYEAPKVVYGNTQVYTQQYRSK